MSTPIQLRHLRALVGRQMEVPEIASILGRNTDTILKACEFYGIECKPYTGPKLCHRGHNDWTQAGKCRVCFKISREQNSYRESARNVVDRAQNIETVLQNLRDKRSGMGVMDLNGVLQCARGHTDPNRWHHHLVRVRKDGKQVHLSYCQECKAEMRSENLRHAYEKQRDRRRAARAAGGPPRKSKETPEQRRKRRARKRQEALDAEIRKAYEAGLPPPRQKFVPQTTLLNRILHIGDLLAAGPMPWEREALKAEMRELQRHVRV